MKQFLVLLGLLLVAALLLSSCGYNQNLVSLTVAPQNVTLNGVGLVAQFTATGFYNHPYANKDLTSSVTWTTSAPGIVGFVTPGTPGLLTVLGGGCGSNIQINATIKTSGNSVMTGTTTVNVTIPGCTP
jgi:hypothetical protein